MLGIIGSQSCGHYLAVSKTSSKFVEQRQHERNPINQGPTNGRDNRCSDNPAQLSAVPLSISGREIVVELKEALQVEHYKFVMDRQRYFTELARDAFASYAKLFSGLSAGIIALVSAKEKLQLPSNVLAQLLIAVLLLVTFLGIVASAQIASAWRDGGNCGLKKRNSIPIVHRSIVRGGCSRHSTLWRSL